MEAWEAVLDAAVDKGYIKNRELDLHPDLAGYEGRLLAQMKESLPGQLEAPGPGMLTFRVIQRLFIFAFIKGFEAGCRHAQSDASPCEVETKDMLTGCVKVDLTRELADHANSRPIPDDLFFAFQSWAFGNRERIDAGEADLEDEMFGALSRVFRVGAAAAMEFGQE